MSARLTAAEIEALLGVAGDALAEETLSTEDDPEAAMEAFERGMNKLRAMLAAKRSRSRRQEDRK